MQKNAFYFSYLIHQIKISNLKGCEICYESCTSQHIAKLNGIAERQANAHIPLNCVCKFSIKISFFFIL